MLTKILLADDHSMIRKGIKMLCESVLGYREIEEVATCNQLMKALSRKDFTHLILDINLADGTSFEILPAIRKLYPNLKITILSMQPAAIYGKALRNLRILHYITKSAPEEETVTFLKNFLGNSLPTRSIIYASTENPFVGLTPRELEVLHYMLKGLGTVTIANELNLNHSTISGAKKSIFTKTRTENIVQLKSLASICDVN